VKAPAPPDESRRLLALEALGILDTPPEPAFDALAKAATLVCDVPIGLVSFVARERQWFKANVGLGGATETPRDQAFCAHALGGPELLEVEDATRDPRFRDNPLVTSAPSIRFYAGVPLRMPGGVTVGTLCVLDREPRSLNDNQRAILRCLAAAAVELLQARRAAQMAQEARNALRDANERTAVATEGVGIGIWEYELRTEAAHWDARMYQLYGWPEGNGLPNTEKWRASLPPESLAAIRAAVVGAVAGTAPFAVEFAVVHPDGTPRRLRSAARVIRNELEEPSRLIGATWDVTEAFESAARLRRQAVVSAVQARVAAAANLATTLRAALQSCLDAFCQETEWELAHVYVPAADHPTTLRSSGVWNAPRSPEFASFREATEKTVFAMGEGLVGTTWAERSTKAIDLGDALFVRRAAAARCGLRYGAATPVFAGDEVVAILELFTTREDACDDAFLALLGYSATQMGRVVFRERAESERQAESVALRHTSTIDELTGLLNRRGFFELASERLRAMQARSQRAVLVFADLDGLKRINDELGHAFGDRALVETAHILRTTLRDGKLMARLGGDELVELACVDGAFHGDALRAHLEAGVANANARPDRPFTLAMSLGVSSTVDGERSADELIHGADGLMYQYKQARRVAGATRG
jgi:diguanylate cyclase (GGDEF)-like protein